VKLIVVALLALATPAAADMAAPPRPRPKPVEITPAVEIATTARSMVGAWTCKGVQLAGDGSSRPALLALAVSVDPDGAWIATTADETIDGKSVLKYTEYRTYDAVAKQWTQLEMANTTAYASTTSLGEANGQWTWAGTLHGATAVDIHNFEKRTATHVDMWGEQLLAGTWQKVYQFSCARP
jgi:hypothetical protein